MSAPFSYSPDLFCFIFVAIVMANHSFTQRHVDIIWNNVHAHITELIMRTPFSKSQAILVHMHWFLSDMMRKYIIEYFKCAHIKTKQHSTAQYGIVQSHLTYAHHDQIERVCAFLLCEASSFPFLSFYFSHFMKVSFSFFFYLHAQFFSCFALFLFRRFISALHLPCRARASELSLPYHSRSVI